MHRVKLPHFAGSLKLCQLLCDETCQKDCNGASKIIGLVFVIFVHVERFHLNVTLCPNNKLIVSFQLYASLLSMTGL